MGIGGGVWGGCGGGVENFRGKFVWEGQKGRRLILEDVLYYGVNFAGGTWEIEKIKNGIIAA